MLSGPIEHVKKRNGSLATFDPHKITVAMGKALEATGVADGEMASVLCGDVVEVLPLALEGMSPE